MKGKSASVVVAEDQDESALGRFGRADEVRKQRDACARHCGAAGERQIVRSHGPVRIDPDVAVGTGEVPAGEAASWSEQHGVEVSDVGGGAWHATAGEVGRRGVEAEAGVLESDSGAAGLGGADSQAARR